MADLKYVLKRLRDMDYKAFLKKIEAVREKTGMSRLRIFNDMRRCAVLYGAGYMDYDLFEMYDLTDEQRDTYLTRGRNNALVVKYCNKDVWHLFQNKDEFCELFKEYVKRDWLLVIRTQPIDQGYSFPRAGSLKGLTLRNLHLPPSDGGMGVWLQAHDDAHPIEGVRFENVTGYGPVTKSGRVEADL